VFIPTTKVIFAELPNPQQATNADIEIQMLVHFLLVNQQETPEIRVINRQPSMHLLHILGKPAEKNSPPTWLVSMLIEHTTASGDVC
jgi:hypothetical protein